MKKWIKNYWFSIILFLFSVTIMAIGTIYMLTDEELFLIMGAWCCYGSLALLFTIIAIANFPRKDKDK